MRGAQVLYFSLYDPSRIIPADAGSTRSLSADKIPREDHPRGCGEHNSVLTMDKMYEGSSPRMRGAPGLSRPQNLYHRIIPADAGSTAFTVRPNPHVWDHPRGCGEHGPRNHSTGYPLGSSPRMRGARDPDWPDRQCPGIIPADAGSTFRLLL